MEKIQGLLLLRVDYMPFFNNNAAEFYCHAQNMTYLVIVRCGSWRCLDMFVKAGMLSVPEITGTTVLLKNMKR